MRSHERGPRKGEPFVAINCSAVPEALLESELFGHARGAFTDAPAPRTGPLLQANGGTLLLDEIGDMPLVAAAEALRALQERTLRPVGGDEEVPFDVRVDRDHEPRPARAGRRASASARTSTSASTSIHVELPPLRARGGDVLLLAQHFVDLHAARAGKRVDGPRRRRRRKLLAYQLAGQRARAAELHRARDRRSRGTSEIAGRGPAGNSAGVQALARAHRDATTPPSWCRSPRSSGATCSACVEAVRRQQDARRRRSSASRRKTLYRKLEEYGATDGAKAG